MTMADITKELATLSAAVVPGAPIFASIACANFVAKHKDTILAALTKQPDEAAVERAAQALCDHGCPAWGEALAYVSIVLAALQADTPHTSEP